MKFRINTALALLLFSFGPPYVQAQLIIPGDFPDPLVMKISNTFGVTTVSNGKDIVAFYSVNNKAVVTLDETSIDGKFLPWALRAGVADVGSGSETSSF